jgi:hypothetical protein
MSFGSISPQQALAASGIDGSKCVKDAKHNCKNPDKSSDDSSGVCASNGQPDACGLPQTASASGIQSILQIALGVLAALSVLFIVIGGLRMVLSQGSPEDTSKGRSTMIYALVGLVLALIAEAFVSFVLDQF